MQEPTYHLDSFEGPLDLLLTLISKNKVDIHNIPIVLICDQYMAYIAEAQEMNLDIASEFIVMASNLMLIKSRMLLPREQEDEEDPRKPLVDALKLYKQAKEAAAELKPLYALYSGRTTKENDDIPPEKGFPLGLDVDLMGQALALMMKRLHSQEQEPVTLINPLIKNRVVSVEDMIDKIVEILDERDSASLFFLLKDAPDKPELLARFMGILEMIKIGRITIVEDKSQIAEDLPEEVTDDMIDKTGLLIRFALNREFVATEMLQSEFDHSDEETRQMQEEGQNDGQ